VSSRLDPRRIWYLAPLFVAILAVTLAAHTLTPYSSWLDLMVRGSILFAYQTIFLVIVSTNYMLEIVRFFGRPFVTLHHIATRTSLVLILVHPVGVAISRGTARVLVPETSSWYQFFLNASRPALYLFAIAATAATLRGALGRGWRPLHWLTYLAFLLATVHAMLLSITFRFAGVRIAAVVMALTVVAMFALKRRPRRRRAPSARGACRPSATRQGRCPCLAVMP